MQVGRLGFSLAVLPCTSKSLGGHTGGTNENFEHKCVSGDCSPWDDCWIGTVRGARDDDEGKTDRPLATCFFQSNCGDKVNYPLGEHPGGYIEITPTRYWVMLIDPARKAPAAATLTDAEAISLMKSQVAYTGKYDLDPAQTPEGIKITIHVDAASNQALAGTNRVLYARVDGNKMSVKSPTLVVGTSGVTSVVELEYAKAE
jgi:hypothetical protein